MNYKGWQITQIRVNVWKATKGDKQINVSSPRLLRALIDEDSSHLPYAKNKVNIFIDEKLTN